MEPSCHQRLRGVSFASDAGNVVKSFSGHKKTPNQIIEQNCELDEIQGSYKRF